VIGLGAPDRVRVRFRFAEIGVLVDVLRKQRADATRDAAAIYDDAPARARAVDDRHDRLRAIEALLMQLEDQTHTGRGAVLVAETQLMSDVIRDGADEAIRRLWETHQAYEDRARPQSRDALLNAAKTARAWVATLTGFDQVDRGWEG
jgi:hypothetical protein